MLTLIPCLPLFLGYDDSLGPSCSRSRSPSDLLQLVAWIEAKRAEIADQTPHDSLSAAQTSLQGFRSYKKDEKPPKSEERAQLEAHYATLQTKLRLNNRPAYHPEEGLLVSNISNLWKMLESVCGKFSSIYRKCSGFCVTLF